MRYFSRKSKDTANFKRGNEWGTCYYPLIFVLTCFSKMVDKIMYNRVYKHVNEKNLLYKKEFGFEKVYST